MPPPRRRPNKSGAKGKRKPAPASTTPTDSASSTAVDNALAADIEWCLTQLACGFKLKGGQEPSKVRRVLMSESTTVVQKRAIMRLAYGDYHEQMRRDPEPRHPEAKAIRVTKTSRRTRTTDHNVFFGLSTTQREARLAHDVPPASAASAANAAFSAAALAAAKPVVTQSKPPPPQTTAAAKGPSLWSAMKHGEPGTATGESQQKAAKLTPPAEGASQRTSLWQAMTGKAGRKYLRVWDMLQQEGADERDAIEEGTAEKAAHTLAAGSSTEAEEGGARSTFAFNFGGSDTPEAAAAAEPPTAQQQSVTAFSFNFGTERDGDPDEGLAADMARSLTLAPAEEEQGGFKFNFGP